MKIKYSMSTLKTDLLAAICEFLGTMVFLLIAFGGIQAATQSERSQSEASAGSNASGGGAASINSVASIDQLMYISVSMGLGLLVAAWMFYRVSGSIFNPNVGLALMLCKVLTVPRFLLYCISQFLGAIVASALIDAMTPGESATSVSLGAGTSVTQGVFIEMFITAALSLAVLMLAAEKHNSTHLAPIGIGLTLFVCHLWAVIYTGAATNTARAFGPSVTAKSFSADHWVYWVGPTCGGLLAAGIFHFLKFIKYYDLNPGQDSTKEEDSPDVHDKPGNSNGDNAENGTGEYNQNGGTQ